jgi:hypothetical protein
MARWFYQRGWSTGAVLGRRDEYTGIPPRHNGPDGLNEGVKLVLPPKSSSALVGRLPALQAQRRDHYNFVVAGQHVCTDEVMKVADPCRRLFEAIGCCANPASHAVSTDGKSQRAKLKDLKSSWLRFWQLYILLFEFVLVNVNVLSVQLSGKERFTLCLDGKSMGCSNSTFGPDLSICVVSLFFAPRRFIYRILNSR